MRLFIQLLHLIPVFCSFLELVVFQQGLCRVPAGPLHHSFDPQVVDVEGSDADIHGRVDGVVCGLSRRRPVPSGSDRVRRQSERCGTEGLGE